MQPVALTIAGSDPSGGAGIQADLKTFHQFGVYGEAVITLLTVQNTVALEHIEYVPSVLVLHQLRAVLDDIPPTDPPFIERLTRRSLCAQLAVITRYVGIDGRPDWPALQTWAKLGFGMAAHSRTHSANMDPDVGFMSEVVGALHDLAEHGLRTTVFVQPGSWRDSLFFDSRAKVRNWRGSLFRTFTEVTGAYVYPGWTQLPPPDSLRLGFGHITISDGMSHAAMLDRWQAAQTPGRGTVFVIHSLNLPSPDTLNWFLDSIVTARLSGRVRLVCSERDLF